MQQSEYSQLFSLMQGPVGQELIRYLSQHGGSAARSAAAQAAAGDLSAARETLTPLLKTPELQALLRQLEESK